MSIYLKKICGVCYDSFQCVASFHMAGCCDKCCGLLVELTDGRPSALSELVDRRNSGNRRLREAADRHDSTNGGSTDLKAPKGWRYGFGDVLRKDSAELERVPIYDEWW